MRNGEEGLTELGVLGQKGADKTAPAKNSAEKGVLSVGGHRWNEGGGNILLGGKLMRE